jgi:hypothetical protein
MITASRRASATIAFFTPRRLAIADASPARTKPGRLWIRGKGGKKLPTCRAKAVIMAASQQLICLVITMGKTSPTFKQRDLTRAYRAVEAAGGHVARIEIANGKIILVPAGSGESPAASGKSPEDKIKL